MPREREAVQLGLREPPAQIGREVEVKHRIALAPGEQDGNLELRQASGDGGDRRERRVRGRRRDVGDEVCNRAPIPARRVRAEVGAANVLANPAVSGGERCPHEERRPPAGHIAQEVVAGEANRQRHTGRRQGDAGVREQDPTQALPVRERPAERDRPAPVVGGEDDRAFDGECVENAAEVVDPLRERSRAGALREAHRDVVDGEHAIAVTEATVERAPEQRPRRVAVHADDGQRRVEPVGRRAIEGVHPRDTVGERHREASRPGRLDSQAPESPRIEPGPRGHQMISATLALRPDPMPMQRTRSPAEISP